MEFVAEGPPRRRLDASLKFSAQVAALAMEEGLLARPLPVNDIVGISPPLMLTRSDADEIAEMLQRAVTRAAAMLSVEQRRGSV